MSNVLPAPEPGPNQEVVSWIVQPAYGPTTYLNKYRVRNLGDLVVIDIADRAALEAEGLIAPAHDSQDDDLQDDDSQDDDSQDDDLQDDDSQDDDLQDDDSQDDDLQDDDSQ